MKPLACFLFLCLLSGITLPAQQQNNEQIFTIQAEITGLAVGDTLRFEYIGQPGFELTPAFDVVRSGR